jgi:hypothetical protein
MHDISRYKGTDLSDVDLFGVWIYRQKNVLSFHERQSELFAAFEQQKLYVTMETFNQKKVYLNK